MWHMGNGFEQTLEGHRGAVFALAQGGAYLFSAGDDTGVKTWQFNESSFVPVIELSGHTAPVQALKVCGNVLLSADRGGMVSMWDLQSGQQSGSITTNHTAPLMGLWVEESHLFTAALDGHVKTWDAAGAMLYDHLVTNQHNQPSGVTSLAVVSDAAADGDPNNQGEPVLVTACDDKALKMWRMPTFDKRGILASRVGHSDVVRCIAKVWRASVPRRDRAFAAVPTRATRVRRARATPSSRAGWTAPSSCGSSRLTRSRA